MFASRHHHLIQQLIALLLLLFMVDNVQNTKSRTQQQRSPSVCHFNSEIDPELRHSRVLDKKYQIKLDNENIKYFIPGDTYTSKYKYDILDKAKLLPCDYYSFYDVKCFEKTTRKIL